MRTRRDFLASATRLTLGAAALGVAGCTRLAAAEGEPIEPGLQLFTVRKLLEEDFGGTLEQVAAVGYREVQVSPRAGHSPAEIRSLLDANGLVCPSIHLDPQNTTEQEIEAAQLLGARTVFLSAPIQVLEIKGGQLVGIRTDVGLDTWRGIADELNESGAKFREAGLLYGYHNHAFEFPPVDGVVPYDLVLERTDPELVVLEVDLGWMQVAGVDPLHYFERYPGRFPVCHVKDVGDDGSFVDPGTGTVNFQRAFDAASRAGLRHYFVEHDTTGAPLATARAGHRYLAGLRAH